jgi:hypothetical protein
MQASRAVRKGDSQKANRYFRARVAAQGFTLIAVVAGGMFYSRDRERTKELRELQRKQDMEEKRLRWIRELEARDDEEKAMRALLTDRRRKPAVAESEMKQENGEERIVEKVEEKKSSGGVLAALGLWSRPADAASQIREQEERGREREQFEISGDAPAAPKKERKENPRSSLGSLGEIMAAKKEPKVPGTESSKK